MLSGLRCMLYVPYKDPVYKCGIKKQCSVFHEIPQVSDNRKRTRLEESGIVSMRQPHSSGPSNEIELNETVPLPQASSTPTTAEKPNE